MESRSFYFHFDVRNNGHEIDAESAIRSLECIQELSNSLNNGLFHGGARLRFRVGPPQKGSHKLQVFIDYITANPESVAITPAWLIADGVIEELSGKGIKAHAKSLTRDTVNFATSLPKIPASLLADIHLQCCIKAMVLTPVELMNAGLSIKKFRGVFVGKNKAYGAFRVDSNIQGVGFTDTCMDSVIKGDFGNHVIDLPDDEDKSWVIEDMRELKVISPVGVQNPPHERRWYGQRIGSNNTKNTNTYFTIEDENFWARVNNKEITPSTDDFIKVQWIRTAQVGAQSGVVYSVLDYCGVPVSPPRSNEFMRQVLEAHNNKSQSNGLVPNDLEEMDLFDYANNAEN